MQRDWGVLKLVIPIMALAGLLLVIGGVALYLIVPPIVFGRMPPPQQPINFPHTVHVLQMGIDCTFCHRNVTKEAAASIPAVEQCMFCHKIVGKDKPEVQKLVAAWENKEPLNWKRVFRMPDHVRFVHEVHIRAELQCSRCHGRIEKMEKVRQDVILRMGDCLGCHRSMDGQVVEGRTLRPPTDCVACHY